MTNNDYSPDDVDMMLVDLGVKPVGKYPYAEGFAMPAVHVPDTDLEEGYLTVPIEVLTRTVWEFLRGKECYMPMEEVRICIISCFWIIDNL